MVAGLQSPIERELYLSRLSEEYGLAKAALTSAVEGARRQAGKKERRQQEQRLVAFREEREDYRDPQREQYPAEARCEDAILMGLYRNPEYVTWLREMVSPEDFATDTNRRFYQALCRLSEEGRPLEPMAVSEEFDTREMSRLTGLMWESQHLNYSREELEKVVERLKGLRGRKTDQELLSMSDQEVQEMIARESSFRSRSGGGGKNTT